MWLSATSHGIAVNNIGYVKKKYKLNVTNFPFL